MSSLVGGCMVHKGSKTQSTSVFNFLSKMLIKD